MAFDSDFNSRNTLFQYNYSHDNEGGFMLICTPGQRDPKQNLGNIGTIVRYNISRNDLARIFHVSAAQQTQVYGNAIYVGPDIDVQMLIVTNWDGWADGALFRDNTFFVKGTARYGPEASRNKEGAYQMAPGWGLAKGILFEGNRYIGRQVDRPEDAKGIVEPTADDPTPDWNAPQFDPAHPEDFDAFMANHRKWIMRLFEGQFGKPFLDK